MSMQLTLTGHPITSSYLADPVIGHGHFSITNRGSDIAQVRVAKAVLHSAEGASPLSSLNVFDLDHEVTLLNEAVEIAPGHTLEFYLGFEPVAFAISMAPVAVELQVLAGTDTLSARSEITLQQRIQRY